MNLLEQFLRRRLQNKENFKSKEEGDDLWASISKELVEDKTKIGANKSFFNKWTIGIFAILISLSSTFLFLEFNESNTSIHESISMDPKDDQNNEVLIKGSISETVNKTEPHKANHVKSTDSIVASNKSFSEDTKSFVSNKRQDLNKKIKSTVPLGETKNLKEPYLSNNKNEVSKKQSSSYSTTDLQIIDSFSNNPDKIIGKKELSSDKSFNEEIKSNLNVSQTNRLEFNSNLTKSITNDQTDNSIINNSIVQGDEIEAINFLEYTTLKLFESNSGLDYDDYKINKIDLAVDSKKNYFELGLRGGINYYGLNFSNSDSDTIDINLINKTETGSTGSIFAIDLDYVLKRNLKIGIGLEYGSYNTRLQYKLKVSDTKVNLFENSVNQYTVDTVITSRTTRNFTSINKNQIISFPILLGFQKSEDSSRWMYGISAGPLLNFRINQNGKSIDGKGLYSYDNDSDDVLFKTFGLGFRAKLSLGYKINSKVRIRLAPEWTTFAKTQVKDLSIKGYSYNFNLGLKYRFNKN